MMDDLCIFWRADGLKFKILAVSWRKGGSGTKKEKKILLLEVRISLFI